MPVDSSSVADIVTCVLMKIF